MRGSAGLSFARFSRERDGKSGSLQIYLEERRAGSTKCTDLSKLSEKKELLSVNGDRPEHVRVTDHISFRIHAFDAVGSVTKRLLWYKTKSFHVYWIISGSKYRFHASARTFKILESTQSVHTSATASQSSSTTRTDKRVNLTQDYSSQLRFAWVWSPKSQKTNKQKTPQCEVIFM